MRARYEDIPFAAVQAVPAVSERLMPVSIAIVEGRRSDGSLWVDPFNVASVRMSWSYGMLLPALPLPVVETFYVDWLSMFRSWCSNVLLCGNDGEFSLWKS